MPPTIAEQLIASGLESSQKAPDLFGSYAKGAELAMQAEKVQQQRMELEQKKQENEMQKFQMAGQWFDTYAKMPEGAAKKAFGNQFIPNGITALGLQDKIHPNVLDMMKGDSNLSAYIISEAQRGNLDVSILSQPAEVAKLYAEHGAKFTATQEAFQQTVSDVLPQALEAQQKRLLEEGKNQRSVDMFGKRDEISRDKEFEQYAQELANNVRNSYKPLQDKKTSVRLAHTGLAKVLDEIRAGKKPSSIDFNTAARSLAKAFNSGAMTDADVADFRNLTGIDNIAEDTIRKWIVGGANAKSVSDLIGIAERSASELDRQSSELSQSFAPQFQSSRFAGREQELQRRSGLSAFQGRTLPKPKEKSYRIRDRNMSVTELKAIAKSNTKVFEAMAKELGKSVEQFKKELGL